MKSIEEKAEEYIGDYYKKLGVDKNLYPIDVEISKSDFKAGANYVLDLLIEEDDKYDTIMECYPALTRIIRELKK